MERVNMYPVPAFAVNPKCRHPSDGRNGTWHSLGSWDGTEVSLRLQPAGHILGSAYAEIRLQNAECGVSGQVKRKEADSGDTVVVFSGDLGDPFTPLLPDPVPPESIRLVHGEEEAQRALEEALRKQGSYRERST